MSDEKEYVEMSAEEERAYVVKLNVEDHWKRMEILRRISLCPTCRHCENIDIDGNIKCRFKYGVEKAKTYCIDYEYSQEAESRWKEAEKQC
jgi:hypothetical protein